MSNFIKVHIVGAELFPCRWMDRHDKAFQNFVNVPEICKLYSFYKLCVVNVHPPFLGVNTISYFLGDSG
jgi:hypothetical protein